jgi:hypothetical protein
MLYVIPDTPGTVIVYYTDKYITGRSVKIYFAEDQSQAVDNIYVTVPSDEHLMYAAMLSSG